MSFSLLFLCWYPFESKNMSLGYAYLCQLHLSPHKRPNIYCGELKVKTLVEVSSHCKHKSMSTVMVPFSNFTWSHIPLLIGLCESFTCNMYHHFYLHCWCKDSALKTCSGIIARAFLLIAMHFFHTHSHTSSTLRAGHFSDTNLISKLSAGIIAHSILANISVQASLFFTFRYQITFPVLSPLTPHQGPSYTSATHT